MDPKKIGKQMMDFNKAAFDNSFSMMCAVQDQAEKTLSAAIEQLPWFPKDGNKLLVEWVNAYKKGRDKFKAEADENFKKMEDYFSVR